MQDSPASNAAGPHLHKAASFHVAGAPLPESGQCMGRPKRWLALEIA